MDTQKQHLDFFKHELENNMVPFWTNRALDWVSGGYFTCFSNDGKELFSKDKYTWSQGRMVWIFSELARVFQNEKYVVFARLGVDFLLKHALLPNGNCAFLLNQYGEPQETTLGSGYDTSIYADCFVVIGLSRYSAVTKNGAVLDFAESLYKSICRRLQRKFRTDPYPIPAGYRAHGISMIMLNTSQELMYALRALGHDRAALMNDRCNDYVNEIFSLFYKDDLLLHEMVNPSLEKDDSLLARYVNPGHSLESLWFILHQVLETGDNRRFSVIADMIERIYDVGWDQQFGGLFLFADKQGGRPLELTRASSTDPMVEKVRSDWSHKLWWPHSEALYTTLLAFHLTGRPRILELYNRTKDYVFSTFPNPDITIGEWIQIRDRYGKPIEKTVALPVKDPFHIIRNLLLIIQLLEKMPAKSGDERRIE